MFENEFIYFPLNLPIHQHIYQFIIHYINEVVLDLFQAPFLLLECSQQMKSDFFAHHAIDLFRKLPCMSIYFHKND